MAQASCSSKQGPNANTLRRSTHLHVLEKVKDAELLLADGREGGVAELQSALALTIDGSQVVKLLMDTNRQEQSASAHGKSTADRRSAAPSNAVPAHRSRHLPRRQTLH